MNIEELSQMFKVIGEGFGPTVSVFLITIVFSLVLGLLVSFASNSKNFILRSLTRGYVFLMRGTPLMLQLFFIYFGLPYIPYVGPYLKMDRFTAAAVAFVLNYAAYFCEIFRGGLLSIDKGQYEAAKVLGMSKFQTMIKIVLPQMFKVTLPPVANETITLVKDTALISVIGILDLLAKAKQQVIARVDVTPFIVVAVFYLVIIFVLTKVFAKLEKKFAF